MLVTLSFQVLPRMRQCCYCASCCYSGNAAVAVPFALAPARMLGIYEKSAREHSLNRHTRVCVRLFGSNATSTFLLYRGNAVGPPDSISGRRRRCARHGMRSGNPVASAPITYKHTHTHTASEQRDTHTLIRIHLPPPHCSLQCQSIPSITMPSALRCLPVRASK